jgi:Tfp pilus assembly protein PilF/DNA-binding CsgD family transcriptional regulator
MIALRQEADEKEIWHLQIRTREKLAYFYFHIAHKYGSAFENYLAYYELLKNVPVSAFPEKQELIAHIGSAYFNFGDNQNARKYFAIAQKIAPSYKKRFPINLQNTLGLIYRTEKNYKTAERYFRKAYAMAEANHDSTWMGIAAGNLGINFFQQGKFAEALPLLELDVRQSMLAHEMDNALNSLTIIMKIKAQRGEWNQVSERLALATKLLPLTGSPELHQRELFGLLSKKNAVAGNYQLAYRYADSAAIIRDTLFNRRNTVLLTRIEQKAEIEKHQDEVQVLEANKRFQNLLLYSLAIGMVLLFVIAALFLNRQRLVYRQRQQLLRSEKENIEHELQQAAAKLNDFKTRIREKNKLIEEFTLEMNRLQVRTGKHEVSGQHDTLNRLQQATILTEEQWEEFREIFETVHSGYLQRLKVKVPGLSPAETRFMVLNKLELTNKEMAAMLGVSAEAIRQTRHRLRKKLETSHNLNLEALSSSI